jgi:acyl-lipid omega-6 desaturase (Delta-12 desaturase)
MLMYPPAASDIADARQWTPILQRYREPNHGRSLLEVLITAVPFIGLWILAWASLGWSYWLSLAIAIPAAGFLVRLFMIQHDCGHGAFFRHRRVNDWMGRALGVVTLTAYGYWRHSHAIHHATSGNLEGRGIGDIDTVTVREYFAMPWWRRLAYRVYRHPLVMFGIGPAYQFLLKNRLPLGAMRSGQQWLSTMGTNAAIAVLAGAAMWFAGVKPFMLVHAPIMLLAASIGVWLFYVQHQFENTFWATDKDWSVHKAALHGSSHYDLPALLRWLTANIGIHHVHHLSSRIPFYRLPRVLRDHPSLARAGRLTLRQSFRCIRLTLWDETQRRLVSFQDATSTTPKATSQAFKDWNCRIEQPVAGSAAGWDPSVE